LLKKNAENAVIADKALTPADLPREIAAKERKDRKKAEKGYNSLNSPECPPNRVPKRKK